MGTAYCSDYLHSVLVFSDRSSAAILLQVRPWYMLTGGLMGAFITFTVIRSMDGLGPAQATLFIVVTQILVSYGIELLGLFGVEKAAFEWKNLLALSLPLPELLFFDGKSNQYNVENILFLSYNLREWRF